MTDFSWDPFDADVDRDPYPVWRRLRDEAPVYRNDRHDFWALSRFADVEAAHRDARTFSSAHGVVLEQMTTERAPGGMMITLDQPEHTRLRSLVSRAFTPRRVEGLDAEIRGICTDLLDQVADRDSFDYVQDFAAILPSMVISSLFGVPLDDREELRNLIDRAFHIEPEVGTQNDVSRRALGAIHRYFREQTAECLRNPRDDMMSDLARAEITDNDGTTRALTVVEAADFAVLVIAAGTETVGRLLSWAALVLDEHPEQRAELAADRSMIPDAIEELMRYEAPSPVQGRWTTREVELHGGVIPANSKVVLLTGSAGRDERAFADPDRFDIHRAFDLHLSFGYGIHFCLGAALARRESRIALEETLARYPEWHVDRERAVQQHTSTVRGYSHVPISV